MSNLSNGELAALVDQAALNTMGSMAREEDSQGPAMNTVAAMHELIERVGETEARRLCDRYRTRGVGYAFIERTGTF